MVATLAPPAEEAAPAVPEKMKILIVDDEPKNLLALEAVLDSLGQELVRAGSGKEALRCLMHEDFAVILLDVQMPEMDGFETATLIRSRERNRYSPIVFLTAVGKSEAEMFRGYEVGAVDYLLKPYDPEILRRKVKILLELNQKTTEIKRLNQELMRANAGLELRVQERTAALEARSQELASSNQAMALAVASASRHAEEMSVFSQLTEIMQACVSTQELCRIVAVFAKDLFPGTVGAVYVMDATAPSLTLQSSWGDTALPSPVSFPAADCWAMRRAKPHYRDSTQDDLGCAHVVHPPPAFTFCLPLTGLEGNLGLLFLGSAGAAEGLLEPRQRIALALAYQVSLGLTHLKLKETLREEAIRDPVTGLFNRRYMGEALDREIRRAQRRSSSVAIIVFDLDHFKEVNDSLGHAAGDSLLQGLAGLLKGRLRGEDVSCRQGGDEFMLILPEITERDAMALAEDLRKMTEQLTRERFPSLAGTVTLSSGVALFPHDASSAEGLLKAADLALYRSKGLGRNRVFAASQLAAPAGP